MKRILYFLCALAILCTACEKDNYDITSITKTEVTTLSSSADVTIHVADQNGYTTRATIEEYGVYIAEGRTPSVKDEKISFTTGYNSYHQNSYSFTLEALAANTTYHILPFVANSLSMVAGDVVTFTTDGSAKVTTNAATNITASSAKLNGSVTANGNNVSISKRGFLFSTSSNPTLGASGVDNWETAGKTGTYSVTYTDLDANTRYYFRAYAIVNNETVYGATKYFTTLASSGGGTTLGSKVEDFVGTYSARAYNVDEQKYETWDNVIIFTYSNGNGEEWVAVDGLNGGEGTGGYGYAVGEYDTNYKAVRLYSSRGVNKRFTFSDTGDTLFFAVFYPTYVEKTDNTFATFHAIQNGNGYNGSGEAFLTFNSSGQVVLGPAATADSDGYKANGFSFVLFYDATNVVAGWWPTYVEVTLTKTSSSVSAPAKIKAKTATQWHAPMTLPDHKNLRTAHRPRLIKK